MIDAAGPAAGSELTVVGHHIGPLGGMERQMTEIVTGCLAAGWNVTVIAWACDLPAHPRLRFVRVRGPARPVSIGLLWFMLAAGVLTGRHGRGILHANGAILLRRTDVLTMHFCHRAYSAQGGELRGSQSSLPYTLNKRLVAGLSMAAERLCLRPRRTGAVVAISAGVGRETARHYPVVEDRIEVIPYGVDCDRFRPDEDARSDVRQELGCSPEVLLALFVGGEWDRKGLEPAIGSLAARPRWHLLVAGVGDKDRFVLIADQAGVLDRVRFLGKVADPERLYAAADAFVFPTAYETFSLVTHEAAAAGLPLLAGKTNGIEDLIQTGVNGWFIERDAPDIAGRLAALEDPETRHRLGVAARAAATRYGWDRAVEGHLRVYARLQGDTPAAPPRCTSAHRPSEDARSHHES